MVILGTEGSVTDNISFSYECCYIFIVFFWTCVLAFLCEPDLDKLPNSNGNYRSGPKITYQKSHCLKCY